MSPIPDHLWQPIRDYVGDGISDEEWAAAKARFPVGAIVEGVVLANLPVGSFLALGDRVLGQVEVISMKDGGERVKAEDWPDVGSRERAVVLAHAHGHQIRLSMRPSDLEQARAATR